MPDHTVAAYALEGLSHGEFTGAAVRSCSRAPQTQVCPITQSRLTHLWSSERVRHRNAVSHIACAAAEIAVFPAGPQVRINAPITQSRLTH